MRAGPPSPRARRGLRDRDGSRSRSRSTCRPRAGTKASIPWPRRSATAARGSPRRIRTSDSRSRTSTTGDTTRCGRLKDSEYRFPYPDGSFDVVFAVSVFTHLLPEGAERYVAESVRVLKPGGRFFATWFLLNDASMAALDARREHHLLPAALRRRTACTTAWNPEAAVAYDEPFVMGLYAKYGLTLTQPAGYGSWSGRAALGLRGISGPAGGDEVAGRPGVSGRGSGVPPSGPWRSTPGPRSAPPRPPRPATGTGAGYSRRKNFR